MSARALLSCLLAFSGFGSAHAETPESLRLAAAAVLSGASLAAGDPPPAAGPDGAAPAKKIPASGPEAVLEFERSFRGPKNKNYVGCCHGDKPHAPIRRKKEDEAYPSGKPVPFSGLTQFTPMTQKLWKPADIRADFEKNKGEGQEAVLVIVKTEACHLSESRVCSAATAAIEKRSTPALAKFRVYGVWIRGNPDQQGKDWQRWEEDVAQTYRFEQGPGAKIIVLLPGTDRPFEADAARLGLTVDALEKNGGKTPLFEAFLNENLEMAAQLRKRK